MKINTNLSKFNNPQFAKNYKNINLYCLDVIKTYVQQLLNSPKEIKYYNVNELSIDAVNQLEHDYEMFVFANSKDNYNVLNFWNQNSQDVNYLGDIWAFATIGENNEHVTIELYDPNDVLPFAIRACCNLISDYINEAYLNNSQNKLLKPDDYQKIINTANNLAKDDQFLNEVIYDNLN